MLNRLKDVFESFQKHEVRYIVIGGIAAVLYGVPRATFDLGILIEASPKNTQHLLDALLDAGIVTASLTNVDEILSNDNNNFQRSRSYRRTNINPRFAFSGCVESSHHTGISGTVILCRLTRRFNFFEKSCGKGR